MTRSRLIVMRHATAGGGGPDHARRLTHSGIQEARRAGLRLAELEFEPDRACCSSATRCRETWEYIGLGLRSSPRVEFDASLYNASARTLIDTLAGIVEGETLLLLAHNPGVSVLTLELARDDAANSAGLRAGFAPASMALFEIDGSWSMPSKRKAELVRFERPAFD
ncbi:MAG: histidine phosphatase family protein [Myxococcota bacterium]